MSLIRIPLRILACFLRPPWGVMLLISCFMLFAVALIGKKNLDDLPSLSLFSHLEETKKNKKESIAERLTQFDETGIRLLIRGLSSKEEATAFSCHQTLKQQLSEWQSLPNDQASSRYLILSKELAENSKTGTNYARQLSRELAVIVQNDTLNRGFEGQRLVSQNCQRVIDAWQASQRDQMAAMKRNGQPGFETVFSSTGSPNNARVSGINVPYLIAQSANTNDRLQQLTDQQDAPSNEWNTTDFSGSKNQNGQSATPATDSLANSPRVGFYSLLSPVPTSQRNDQVLIARSQQKISPFLTDRLQQVAARELPGLPTQDLMRLLNHKNRNISQESEAILKKRDGFQEDHIQLASKLYHPDASVRKSLLSQLADNDQLETYSWLSELLKDPEQEVRLATAKAIYGQIPLDKNELERLQYLMQSDADQRIAALGQGLETRISTGADGANTRNFR